MVTPSSLSPALRRAARSVAVGLSALLVLATLSALAPAAMASATANSASLATATAARPTASTSAHAPRAQEMLKGVLRLAVAEVTGGRADLPGQWSLETAHRSYALTGRLNAAVPNRAAVVTGAISGAKVRVDSLRLLTGQRAAATASATASASAFKDGGANSPSPRGTLRVLVIPAYWDGAPATGETRASLGADVQSVSDWYQAVSYNQLSVSSDVSDWVQIAKPDGCPAGDNNVISTAVNTAARNGFNLTNYDLYVVYTPSDPTTKALCDVVGGGQVQGVATIGLGLVWLAGNSTVETFAHEIGHTLGLVHGGIFHCTPPLTPDDACDYNPTGDPSDIMGYTRSTAGFSAAERAQLDWTTGRLVDLSQGATTTLNPVNSADPATAGATIKTLTRSTAAHPVSTARTYWLEYRSDTGLDAGSAYAGGILIHVGQDSSVWGRYTVVGNGFAPAEQRNAALMQTPDGALALFPGQSLRTAEGIVISVGQPTATGIPVQATIPPAFLEMTADGGGTVTASTGVVVRSTCTASVSYGGTVTVTPTPDPGKFFTGWSGACTGTAPTCKVTMTTDATAVATSTTGWR